MHQYIDDSLPYRVVRLRPSALVLKHYGTFLAAVPPAGSAVAAQARLAPKHYFRPAAAGLDSAQSRKKSAA